MQALLHAIYPPHCLTCDTLVDHDFAFCPACWRETPFITGLVCARCGLPLPGAAEEGEVLCDDCLAMARPWRAGRAVFLYRGNARRLILALKHGDRMDLAAAAGRWLARTAAPLLAEETVIAPVPLHSWRLFRRRYNQSALLAAALARAVGAASCPDLLRRVRRTPSQEGRNRAERLANLDGAIRAHPRRAERMQGRPVLLVDDVMTSGATFAAATRACLAAGARDVAVLALARVAKNT